MIFGLINKNSGPGFHRIHVPLLLMKDTDVFITNAVEEKHFEEKQPTTIFYNRTIGDDVLKLQSKYHFKIVVDVDDYWHLSPSHILYDFHMSNRMPEQHIKHIRLADVVTTTHERLAEKIYPINRNVVVLPNAIPTYPEFFPTTRIRSRDYIRRVFWQGSITHGKDIELLRGPIKRLDKKRFAMIIAGYTENVQWHGIKTKYGNMSIAEYQTNEWDRMVTIFTNGLQLKGTVLQGTGVDRYYYNYRYADICVAPLVENEFNSMKSNLKVLEAAHIGLPVIASDVHPYKDMPGVLYVQKQSDWCRWLNAESAVLQASANELKKFCKEHYNFEKINELRKNVLI